MECADWPNLKGKWSQLPQNHTDVLTEIKVLLGRRKGEMNSGKVINEYLLHIPKKNWNEQFLT